MCVCVGVMWSMSVHVGAVYVHRKCLCAVEHICALEKSGYLVGGEFAHCRVRVLVMQC